MKTTKTETPTPPEPMTAARATAELTERTKWVRERYEKAKAAFEKDFAVNPVSTIGWKAEEMVMAQTEHEAWLYIERYLQDTPPVEAMDREIGRLNDFILSYCSGGMSTSLFSNAVEHAKAVASKRTMEDLTRERNAYDRRLKDAAQQA